MVAWVGAQSCVCCINKHCLMVANNLDQNQAHLSTMCFFVVAPRVRLFHGKDVLGISLIDMEILLHHILMVLNSHKTIIVKFDKFLIIKVLATCYLKTHRQQYWRRLMSKTQQDGQEMVIGFKRTQLFKYKVANMVACITTWIHPNSISVELNTLQITTLG